MAGKYLQCPLRLKLTFAKLYVIGLIAYIPQYVLTIIDNIVDIIDQPMLTHGLIDLLRTLIFHSHLDH